MIDLEELISELQRVKNGIHDSHDDAHCGRRHRAESRSMCPAAVGEKHADCDKAASAAPSHADDGKHASKEMEEVLCLLREKRAVLRNSSRGGDELDLSSFGPRGPVEGH